MFGSWTPKRASMKRISDVWSNVSEHTQPPLLQGEITSSGTRIPSPYGPGHAAGAAGRPGRAGEELVGRSARSRRRRRPPTYGYGPGT